MVIIQYFKVEFREDKSELCFYKGVRYDTRLKKQIDYGGEDVKQEMG